MFQFFMLSQKKEVTKEMIAAGLSGQSKTERSFENNQVRFNEVKRGGVRRV